MVGRMSLISVGLTVYKRRNAISSQSRALSAKRSTAKRVPKNGEKSQEIFASDAAGGFVSKAH